MAATIQTPYELLANARRNPTISKEIAREIGVTFTAGAGILATAKLAGLDVDDNPISSKFGQITSGNHHINIWGSYQPLAVLIARQGFGKTTGSSGITSPVKRDVLGTFNEELVTNYFKYKFGPGLQMGTNIRRLAKGEEPKDYLGRPISIQKMIAESYLPITLQDIMDSMEGEVTPKSVATAVGTGALSSLGIGAQTYEPTKYSQAVQAWEKKNSLKFDPSIHGQSLRTDPVSANLVQESTLESAESGQDFAVQQVRQQEEF